MLTKIEPQPANGTAGKTTVPRVLLRTKLVAPPLPPGLIPRPQLIRRLHEGLHRPLTLIHAPAGYGKSTLVQQWLGSDEVPPSAWVWLEESDNVVGNFVAGVSAPIYAPALQAQVAIASADQQAALAGYGQAVLRSLEEVETALFNDHIFAEREQFLRAQVDGNRSALEIQRKQLEVGKINALPVLQVQARYVGSQVLLLRMRNERLAQRVDLHLALGGSF